MSTRWEACGKESEDHMAGHGMRRKRKQDKKRKIKHIQRLTRRRHHGRVALETVPLVRRKYHAKKSRKKHAKKSVSPPVNNPTTSWCQLHDWHSSSITTMSFRVKRPRLESGPCRAPT